MKRRASLFLFLLLFLNNSVAQSEIFSLYFESNIVEGLEELKMLDPLYYKKFELVEDEANVLRKAAGDYITLDETGIYKEKNSIMTIPKSEIRENPKYQVRNNYLFGVVENDSFPCTLDDEHYLFLMPRKTYLFDPLDAKTKLYRLPGGDDFLLMYPEDNGSFSAMLFVLSGAELELKELDLSCTSLSPKSVKVSRKEEGEIPTWFIRPDKNEWTKILNCFVTYDAYEVMPE